VPAVPGRQPRLVLVATLLDLILPVGCAGCGAAGGLLCLPCARALGGPPGAVSPRPEPAGFPPCRAVAPYEGSIRSALIAYKERGRRDLTRPLAEALARAVASHPAAASAGAVLVPVPSRAAAVRQRGADTTGRLATVAAQVLRRAGIAARVEPVLRLSRDTADSAGLGAQGRRANLSGAMAAEPCRAAGAALVIVDDLVTTGATLAEATRALAEAGCPGALAAAVAATARRSGVGLRAGPR